MRAVPPGYRIIDPDLWRRESEALGWHVMVPRWVGMQLENYAPAALAALGLERLYDPKQEQSLFEEDGACG